MGLNPISDIRYQKLQRLVPALLDWFSRNARDLPWRRTRNTYAIWISEIMLQQTQVKTVIPYWDRWMRELPTIEAVAKASPAKIHKLWEGLGYYTRVRNLQKAAQQIVKRHDGKFPQDFEDVLALPGIGRYTAGAICSIAFNQPTPILDGNVIRVLTRVFGIGENPREKKTSAQLWQIAGALVAHAKTQQAPRQKTTAGSAHEENSCSFLNQSLMELGALVCMPRSPRCGSCPVKKQCDAFRTNRVVELPNLGERGKATARRFAAFIIGRNGEFLVRQRPAGVVNAHLWEFPNVEVNGNNLSAQEIFKSEFGFAPPKLAPLSTVKHSITRYRITLEAWRASWGKPNPATPKNSGRRRTPPSETDVWLSLPKLDRLAFTSAHRKILEQLVSKRQRPAGGHG